MAMSGDTVLRLLGVCVVLAGLVARIRGRPVSSGMLAFVGFTVAQIPNLLASLRR
jgi:hypothetical protein